MAAKQGLTAQLSQAGEDAKRAVLSRTGVTSSWFSNLNTVCTIKSAPPRTPDVLQMLATKSGWLYKRNEQHVWQARWCCVVPHMFLYYFDANVVPGHASPICNPTQQQQDDWNSAVQNGYGNRKQHEKRSNFYLFNQAATPGPQTTTSQSVVGGMTGGGGGTGNGANGSSMSNPFPALDEMDGSSGDISKFYNVQPTGIIDLECYTSVHRSKENQHVLELAGDDQVNPDLRAFYFCTLNPEETDDWTDAVLNGRYTSLVDECDAYKQVCEGFAQQLQVLHCDLDNALRSQEESQDELYHVRSHIEEVRRSCWRMAEDCFERTTRCDEIERKRNEAAKNMETIRAQDMGVPATMRLICDYTLALEDVCTTLVTTNQQLEDELKESGQSDQARVEELTADLDLLRKEYQTEKTQWQSQIETLTAKYQQSQKELKDVQKELSSTRMESTMLQNQQRNKMADVLQHKKILKKEVIDLRQKLEDAQSEISSLYHQRDSQVLRAEQERQKAVLLERYVEKVEAQVKVQQNMMEMMSQTGSVYGGERSVGPTMMDHSYGRNVVVLRSGRDTTGHVDEDGDFVAERLQPVPTIMNHEISGGGMPGVGQRRTSSRRQLVDDVDNKSHMSELTEDRTQRHFEHFARDYSPYPDPPRGIPIPGSPTEKVEPRRPPSFIIGVDSPSMEVSGDGGGGGGNSRNKPRLDTIASSAVSLPPGPSSTPPLRRNELPKSSRDSMSVSSDGRHKLSIAQRARLEADRKTTPVRVRLETVKSVDDNSQKQRSTWNSSTTSAAPNDGRRGGSTSSQPSQESGLWRRMEEAVLGPRPEDSSSDDDEDEGDDGESSVRSTRVTDYTDEIENGFSPPRDVREEKKIAESPSSLSLQERSRLQRMKQLEFLRQQGLIKEEEEIAGGAGATNDASSVASTNASRPRSTISFPGVIARQQKS